MRQNLVFCGNGLKDNTPQKCFPSPECRLVLYCPSELFKSQVLPIGCQPLLKQAHVYTCLQYKYFENTVGKGEIAHYE